MKRIAEVIMTVCFLGALAAGLLLTVLREPASISFYENRRLAEFPALTAQAAEDGSFTTDLERFLEDHAALRTTLLECKVQADLALRRPVVNNIVITPERLLPYIPKETVDPEKITGQAQTLADRLKEISDTVEDYGGYYCYVGVPCQYAYFEDDYPWYLENRSERSRLSVAALTQALEQRDVAFLDMGAVFDAEGHPDEYGSRVDNHYTMLGAFETYRCLMEKIAAESGLDFPILGPEDVTFQTLPTNYLGSRERKLMELVNREEYLSILLPKDASLSWSRSNNGVEAASNPYAFYLVTPSYVTYNFYMGGDYANTVIDTGREDLPSILIYGDSFTNALECIAYLSFDEMHSLDLRYYKEMTLDEYIQTVQPDIVVCIRDYEALLTPTENGGVS